MTVTATYPSMQLPAAPPFGVEVPEGFIAHAAPRALAMVRRADGTNPTSENLTVTSDLVQAGAAPAALLDTVLGHHPAATRVEEPTTAAGSATAVIARELAGQRVRQQVTVHVMPTRYAGDVTTALTVVATWPEQDDQAEQTLRGIHDSFSVTGV